MVGSCYSTYSLEKPGCTAHVWKSCAQPSSIMKKVSSFGFGASSRSVFLFIVWTSSYCPAGSLFTDCKCKRISQSLYFRFVGVSHDGNLGSMLTYLCERGWFGELQGPYEQPLSTALNKAFKAFTTWNRQQTKPVNQPRFTPARICRKGRTFFPSLSSKGAASKALSYWLADVAKDFARLPHASSLDRECAKCMVTYAEMLRMIDVSPLLLDDATAGHIYQLGLVHLQTYSSLRHKSSRTLGAQSANRNCWLLLPKHHHMLHMLTDTVLRDRLNPRYQTLFCAESFIGAIGRMAKSCHRASLPRRLLQRYKIRFGMMMRGLGPA